MQGMENTTILIALISGLLSFLSPCVLPLIPSYIVFISGVSIDEISKEKSSGKRRQKVLLGSLMFILGFSLIFISMGASATFIGKFLASNIRIFEIIGGLVVIFFGIHFSGLFRLRILEKEKRFNLGKKPLGYLGAFLVGVAFGAGWTPCIGPILGTILTLAATTQNLGRGIVLLSFYSAGIGIPFLLCGLILHKFFEYFKALRKYLRVITTVGGIMLIGIGILLIGGYFSRISMIAVYMSK